MIFLSSCKRDIVKPPSCPKISVPAILLAPYALPRLPAKPVTSDLINLVREQDGLIEQGNLDKSKIERLLH